MGSREDILQNIRRNTQKRYEKPDLSSLVQKAVKYEDKIGQFCSVMERVGGKAVLLHEGEDVNEVIRKLYPEARRIASSVRVLKRGNESQQLNCYTFHPDEVAASAELDGTDLGIVSGKVGVCENGAVWLEQEMEERGIYFIAEALIVLLDKTCLVNNMHEAYPLIDTGEYGFGVFVSGPSKTADIEQALVMGAHGPREVTVILY